MRLWGMVPVALAALIGGATLVLGSGDASAMGMPNPGQAAGDQATATDVDMTQVQHHRYDRHRHGERYRSRRGNYRYYHGGYWYATPWWSVGVPVGPGVVIGIPAPWSPGWYTYCARKYPNWDRRRGKWRNKHGYWVDCR